MRALVLAAVVCASTLAMARGKGTVVDLDFQSVEVGSVLRLLADTGRFNVIVLEGADTKLEVKAKLVPWDDVLDDVIKRANLAYVREGNVFIVGAPAFIAERKKAKKRTYGGPTIDLDLVGVDALDAAALLSGATGTSIVVSEGNKPATFRVMRVPLDRAKELLSLVTGATFPTVKSSPTKNTTAKGCVAAKLPVGDLEAIGIARLGTKRWALLGTKASSDTYVIGKTDCVAVEGVKVKEIGSDFVLLDNQTEWRLHPPTP